MRVTIPLLLLLLLLLVFLLSVITPGASAAILQRLHARFLYMLLLTLHKFTLSSRYTTGAVSPSSNNSFVSAAVDDDGRACVWCCAGERALPHAP